MYIIICYNISVDKKGAWYVEYKLEFRGGGEYLAAERNILSDCKKEKMCYTSDMKHHFKSIKKGFTLAEVLITLGVIGVVAALTLPSLVAKYQKKTYVTGLKRAYSLLLQDMDYIKYYYNISNLDEIDWGASTASIDNKSFSTPAERDMYIIYKGFHGAKYLEPSAPECTYDVYYSFLNRTSPINNYNLCVNGGFFTPDGMLYGYRDNYIYVDVNGMDKGPNAQGRDIFPFLIDKSKVIVYGRQGWDMNKGYCMTDPSKPQALWGSYCTARVLAEGDMKY